jgi:hypothetical protein
VTWYRRAIEQNQTDAQHPMIFYYLGGCYANGKGVKQDDKEAASWYQRAAEKGHVEAQHNLVVCYTNGTGVGKDHQQAKQWYEKIAAQDNEHSRNVLKSLLQANPSLAKNPNLFFAPSSLKPEDKLDAKALEQLLKCVAEGEQDEAEALIKKDAKLLLAVGKVTDLSGRTFDNVTAFQYALWAMDYHMWTMVQKYLPIEAQAKQHALLDSKGTAHGKHFDLQPLLDALKTYVDNAGKWGWDQRAVDQWGKVGGAQKFLPVHVVNEYCRPDRSFHPCPSEWTSPLPRTRAVEVHDGSNWVKGEFFTLPNSFDVLRIAFARGVAVYMWGAGGMGGGDDARADLESLQALWTARTEQLKALAESLTAESQNTLQAGLK